MVKSNNFLICVLVAAVCITIAVILFRNTKELFGNNYPTFTLSPIYMSGVGLFGARIELVFDMSDGSKKTIDALADTGSGNLIITSDQCRNCSHEFLKGYWPTTEPGKIASSQNRNGFGGGTWEQTINWDTRLEGVSHPITAEVTMEASGNNPVSIAGLSLANAEQGFLPQVLSGKSELNMFFSLPMKKVSFGYEMSGGVKVNMASPDFYSGMGQPDLYWPLVNLKAIVIDGNKMSVNDGIPPVAMIDTGTSYISLPSNFSQGSDYVFILEGRNGESIELKFDTSIGYIQPMTAEQTEFQNGVAIIGINSLAPYHLSFNYTDRYISFLDSRK